MLKRIPQNRQDPHGKWSSNGRLWQVKRSDPDSLGGALYREKGILMRSLDTCRNGWERVLQSYQCRYSQEILCLRQPREMTRQS